MVKRFCFWTLTEIDWVNSMSPTNHSAPDDTVDFVVQDQQTGPKRFQVDCGALSHQGHVRPTNEDHFLVARFGRFLKPLATNLPISKAPDFEEEGYGMVVADGVGGAAAGEVASELAIQGLLHLVVETPDWILSTEAAQAERVLDRFAYRFRALDTLLKERAESQEELAGMGTTLTLACSLGARMILVHVGDSRAYLYRQGTLHQLTRDHTVAQKLYDMGILRSHKEATARMHHSLTSALGSPGELQDLDVQQLTLVDQDKVLLCTDGLTNMVDDPTITALLSAAPTAHDGCQTLLNAALEHGGRDNVTVALAFYREKNDPGSIG